MITRKKMNLYLYFEQCKLRTFYESITVSILHLSATNPLINVLRIWNIYNYQFVTPAAGKVQ
jgi:hypothetical protein